MNLPITIPGSFTRHRYCKHCANNLLPYDTSERIKLHQLCFIVKPSSTQESVFSLRQQTKPAVIGITPHLFVIKEKTIISNNQETRFIMECICSINGCGIILRQDDELVLPVQFAQVKGNVFDLSSRELLALYNYKDPKYMLDYKEPQTATVFSNALKSRIILPPGTFTDFSQS